MRPLFFYPLSNLLCFSIKVLILSVSTFSLSNSCSQMTNKVYVRSNLTILTLYWSFFKFLLWKAYFGSGLCFLQQWKKQPWVSTKMLCSVNKKSNSLFLKTKCCSNLTPKLVSISAKDTSRFEVPPIFLNNFPIFLFFLVICAYYYNKYRQKTSKG